MEVNGENPDCPMHGEFSAFAAEEKFWSVVDREGLSDLPSDMWEALDRLVRAYRNRGGMPADPRIATRMSDTGGYL